MNRVFFLLSFLMGVIVLVSNYLVQFPVKYYGFEKKHTMVETKDDTVVIASHTGSIAWDFTSNELLYKNTDSYLNINVSNKSQTGSIFLDNEVVDKQLSKIEASSYSSSNPALVSDIFTTKDGTFNYMGSTTFISHVNKSFVNLENEWGTGSNSTHFIHFGSSGNNLSSKNIF